MHALITNFVSNDKLQWSDVPQKWTTHFEARNSDTRIASLLADLHATREEYFAPDDYNAEVTVTYDLIVIGGGSGGLAAAQRAATRGARVLLIDAAAALGGTCVNAGCVPKKVLFNAAHIAAVMKHSAAAYGFEPPSSVIPNYSALKEKRDAYVRRLNSIYDKRLQDGGVEVLTNTRARFVTPTHIVLDSGRVLRASHFLIATGGKAIELCTVPGGIEYADTSDAFFAMQKLPLQAAVIGSGYIAVELTSLLTTLGCRVDMFIMDERPLKHFDEDAVQHLVGEMQKNQEAHLRIICGKTERIVSAKDVRTIHGVDKNQVPFSYSGYERVFAAIGRRPNVESLCLHMAGVKTESDGGGIVITGESLQTSVSHIFAVGDCVAKNVNLTPVAISQGRRLADALFDISARPSIVAPPLIPTVVFSHPPLATIGMSESQTKLSMPHEIIRIFERTFVNMFYCKEVFHEASSPPTTYIKMICVGTDERVVGMHIVGEHADEMLQGFAVAIQMGATRAQFNATLPIHPTASEEVLHLPIRFEKQIL